MTCVEKKTLESLNIASQWHKFTNRFCGFDSEKMMFVTYVVLATSQWVKMGRIVHSH